MEKASNPLRINHILPQPSSIKPMVGGNGDGQKVETL